MNNFNPKEYQRQLLTSISDYFNACRELKDPNLAFYKITGVPYQSLNGFEKAMPYFCLRVPTGGGKTWLAAKSIELINRQLLHTEHSIILWLVPSNQIKEQTIKALKDREHPYYAAALSAGAITVLSLDEAKSITPATLNTSTAIIVATRQAFQVENEENRKVYESNGALMSHFEHLKLEQEKELKENEIITYSLANVLRLRRPFIIVDEAHNNRTELGFDTLAKFNPSGIMELTATPDLIKTPSNVLYSVSAVELKQEQMIKLPIELQTEPNWQKCLVYAITCRNDLQGLADREYQKGGNYLRPIVLIQAEAKKTGVETRDVFKVKQELIENHNIPEQEIIIATGEEKGLEKLAADYPKGIQDKSCPVKFVITQKALAEGWDCPFAYILVSIANIHSSTAVEQLLGRILRQPDAIHRHTAKLNQSYAFVVSSNFSATASALKDSLVNSAGFDRKAVGDFVKSHSPNQYDLERYVNKTIPPIKKQLTETANLTKLPRALKEKITWQADEQILTVHQVLNDEDKQKLKELVQDDDSKIIIDEIVEESRLIAFEHFKTPFERGIKLRVPQLAVYIQGELQLFDDAEMLDYPWDLARCDATPTENELSQFSNSLEHRISTIDVNEDIGKMKIDYINKLQHDLNLVYQPEHWDSVKLSAWLCRNLPNPYTTHPSKLAFVSAWLNKLISHFDLATVNQQRFFIRDLLEKRINALRKSAVSRAYQETLFEQQAVSLSDHHVFEYPAYYSPNRYYDVNKYGFYPFKHHYHGQIGDFDSKEEFECACYLDRLAEDNKIQCWIRNIARNGSGFYLQKATDKFYPDFICLLANQSILVVEYKGGDRWNNAEDDREIGELWASLSNDCHFIMVTNKAFHQIESAISKI